MTAGLVMQRIVGVAEMIVSQQRGEQLITYALGSCLGVAVHDGNAGVGGLLHVMLPQSSIDPERAKAQPSAFVDTGVPALFRECYRLGARKERMAVYVAGGASSGAEDRDHFQIGKRNLVALRRLLWKNGVLVRAEDVGGVLTARTMQLDVGTGDVTLRYGGRSRRL